MVLPLFAESKACQSLAEINILYYLSENPAFSGTETESGPFASIACFFFLLIWIPLVFFSKRIINLAPTTSVPPTLTVPSINRAQFRVTCGHCNEVFMVGTFWLIKRCFYWFLSSLSNTLFFFFSLKYPVSHNKPPCQMPSLQKNVSIQ